MVVCHSIGFRAALGCKQQIRPCLPMHKYGPARERLTAVVIQDNPSARVNPCHHAVPPQVPEALRVWLAVVGRFGKPEEFGLFYNATQVRPKERSCCYLRLIR